MEGKGKRRKGRLGAETTAHFLQRTRVSNVDPTDSMLLNISYEQYMNCSTRII